MRGLGLSLDRTTPLTPTLSLWEREHGRACREVIASSKAMRRDDRWPAPLHLSRCRAIRWRTVVDRVRGARASSLAAWQARQRDASATIGCRSPWASASRFAVQILNGELIRHAGYTLGEAARRHADRRRAGGAAAVPAAPASDRGRDPRPVHGRRLRRAQARASRRCSSCGSASASSPRSRWSRAWCSSSSISRRCRACARSTPSSCRWRRSSAPASAQVARHIVLPGAVPAIFAGFRIAVPYAIGAAVIAELISSNRGLGYLVQTGAMNFDTTQRVRRHRRGDAASCMAVNRAGRIAPKRCLLRWRPPHRDRRSWRRDTMAAADARNPRPRQALSGARRAASRRRGSSRTCRSRCASGEFLTIVGPSGRRQVDAAQHHRADRHRERRRDRVRRRDA